MPYLPVATEGQVNGQAEQVVHKLLESVEEVAHLLVRDAEAQEHSHGHGEGQALGLAVHVDGLRVGAPHPQGLLDDQLDLGQVALQGLVAEHLGKHLRNDGSRVPLLLLGVVRVCVCKSYSANGSFPLHSYENSFFNQITTRKIRVI